MPPTPSASRERSCRPCPAPASAQHPHGCPVARRCVGKSRFRGRCHLPHTAGKTKTTCGIGGGVAL
eukprot:6234450-Lingulodinium_polyedra.AAC.1